MRVRARAPGRVNLIGGHTDYTGGLVLPMAIDRATTVEGRRTGDAEIRLRSDHEAEPAIVAVDVDDPSRVSPAWARYVAGTVVATGLRAGFDGGVTTSLPVGMGLSSSAALEVAVALALGADDAGHTDRRALAETLRRGEHLASGVPCGVQDQLASLCGLAGHALLVDCTAMTVAPVPMPSDAEVVVVDSGQRRRLAAVPYAARRDETVAAVAALAEAGSVDAIDDEVLRRRARHVAGENRRVRDCAATLTAGDLRGAGELMLASHASLRDDQQVSTEVLDELVEHLVSRPGVLGARLTGGGFGGSVVALCERGALAGEGWHVTPSAGASVELLG